MRARGAPRAFSKVLSVAFGLFALRAEDIDVLRRDEIRLCGHGSNFPLKGVGYARNEVEKPPRRLRRQPLQRHHDAAVCADVVDYLPGLVKGLG